MHKKFYLWMVILIILIAGCSPSKVNELPEDLTEDTIVIGFSQIGAESSWRDCETQSVYDAASKYGIKLLHDDARQKQDNQVKALRSFIAYQVDVIVLCPMTEKNWDTILSEAKLAEIPVILLDRGIETSDDSLYTTYIGADFIREGKFAAEYLKKKFPNSDEPINIVELRGVEDSTPTMGRSEGFREGIEDCDYFNIVYSKSGEFMPSKGEEMTRKVIESGIEMDVLFSHNDSMTRGALKAMDEAGIMPGKDVVIITFDGEQEMFDEIKKGRVNCIVECNPYLGETVMETAMKIKNKEPIEKNIYSTEKWFSEWSDLTDLPPRGY